MKSVLHPLFVVFAGMSSGAYLAELTAPYIWSVSSWKVFFAILFLAVVCWSLAAQVSLMASKIFPEE